MRRAHRGVWVAVLALAVAAVEAAQPTPRTGPPPDLDRFVARAMQTFDVPGIGVAIVKDDAVIVAKGYGVRKIGESAPVDAKTLFGIASNTKAFTATAIGLLVEEKKIEWDAPVLRYLPAFALWDPFVTRELTVRDLLVHRSGLGLGAGDLLWWPSSTYDRKEIARRLRFIPPATSFRSAYAYDNVLYLVAGELIEVVSGQSWEEFMSSRILVKVGMTGTNVRHSAFDSIAFHVLDHYLGVEAFDWIDGYHKLHARNAARLAAADARAASARDTSSKPSLALGKYAGAYRDQWYGDIDIREESGKLVMRFSHTPLLTGDLEHFQYDTFIARWRDRELRADAYVSFALRPDGSVDQVKMHAVSPSTDFSFDFQDLLLKPVR